ncbi:bis-aminopropyl spermidine synthase family protein [Nocardiopsis rhodophaea]|uniref:bis-aminopropyl spermidine synthase family protein n=1 Tax=Nocardiopsis rhodophaea TaxID=280238 RepID=UPI0031D186FD
MIDHPGELSDLLREQGADAARLHDVLAALAGGGWWSTRDLVRETAVAHRLVERVVEALGEEVERETADRAADAGRETRVRLRSPSRYTGFSRPRLADPVGHLLDGHAEAAAELERLVAEAPSSRVDLDHVAASARTALRRGVFLAARFALPGARLLCVGDHDLTSLATTLVGKDTEAVVVDIDERMLAYIDAAAQRLGLPVRCHFADLRLGLPEAVRGQADLVFTDPPYTPEGVELFVRRGLEGLADPRRGRVLVAYGASETTPALVAKTQSRLVRMGLVSEAIWPDFNRYLGAEAIGATSDLYVLRPTSRTPVGDAAGADAARIYSQGANAKEAAAALPEEDARSVLERVAGDSDTGRVDTVVGAWPKGAVPDGVRGVRLSTWLGSPTPGDRVAINLTGGWEALLDRVILAASAREVHVVVPSSAEAVRDREGQEALRARIEPRYTVRFLRGVPGPRATVVVARARELGAEASPGQRLLWHCQDRAHGRLTSTLREGLIAVTAQLGLPLNKKGARTRVAASAPWLPGHTLLDLPGHRFGELRAVTDRLVAEFRD